MNVSGRKMHFLGNYNHDFPRLAKQSGFFFQLHRGKVNWSEIECLNLDDITKNQNFELLEQNLLNVINCNLAEDYDSKILDKNFVKLFKIAQLGIDYLSYCELYLDRCVVLLQEQLMSLQKELELLKKENGGKNSELKKTKNRKKINNYQCEKCDKAFISDVYLKCHDKRRHGNLSTPESMEGLLKKSVDASQQTERKETFSISIQTLIDETGTATQKNEEICKIKKSHNRKIKRLEKNLNDVKARLQKAEKSLQETKGANAHSGSVSFPSSVHYHPLLQFVPPCFPPPRNIGETIAEYQKYFPNGRSPVSDSLVDVDARVTEGQKSPVSDHAMLKENNADGAERNSDALKIDLICNKENVDPQHTVNATKPLPPPRKTKKKIQNVLSAEENFRTETCNGLSNSVHSVTSIDLHSNQLIDFTTVKGDADPNIHSENLEDKNGKNSHSNASLSNEKREEFASFFQRVVGRRSPKVNKWSTSLKRPLTNLYGSVSSTGKNLIKIEKKLQSAKSALIDDLNNQLRELGIDPEWKGIPKKTMKQKLKDLTHRRTLLCKETPVYTAARQSAEERIFEKLKRNFFIRKNVLPQNSRSQEMEEEIYLSDENLRVKSQESEKAGDRNCAILYDTDEDSCSVSGREQNERQQTSAFCAMPNQQEFSEGDSEEEEAARPGEKKFDIHMFQIKTGSLESRGEKFKMRTGRKEKGELSTNSDFEDNFSNHSGEDFLKATRLKNQL